MSMLDIYASLTTAHQGGLGPLDIGALFSVAAESRSTYEAMLFAMVCIIMDNSLLFHGITQENTIFLSPGFRDVNSILDCCNQLYIHSYLHT